MKIMNDFGPGPRIQRLLRDANRATPVDIFLSILFSIIVTLVTLVILFTLEGGTP